MTEEQFNHQLTKLKNTYGERVFPDERVKMFWRKYQNQLGKEFENAVDMAILRMPTAAQVVDFIDDQLRGTSFSDRADGKYIGDEYKINPLAKEMAEYYVPLIKADIKKFMIKNTLPYNKDEREDGGGE